jgi:hypothetical protein
MADLYVALLHHPVYDKTGAVVTTAVTNLDVHDIARLARTFGVRAFYVCTPVATLLTPGRAHHPPLGRRTRRDLQRHAPRGLALVRQAPDVDAAMAEIERETGHLPRLVATSARGGPTRLTHAALRARLVVAGPPELLLLGTGWGLAAEVLDRVDDVLEPIAGAGPYNHLSVRAAAAIMLDRLRNGR